MAYAELTKSQAVNKLTNLRKTARRVAEKAQESVEEVIRVGLAGGTAFGMGYLQSRNQDGSGNWDFLDIPVSLWVGGGATVLGLYMLVTRRPGTRDSWSGPVMSVGTGALCGYLTVKGAQVGSKAGTSTAGRPPQIPAYSPIGGQQQYYQQPVASAYSRPF